MDFWEIPLRLWEIAQNEKLELGIKFGTERGETQDLELQNSAGFSCCCKTTRMSIILLSSVVRLQLARCASFSLISDSLFCNHEEKEGLIFRTKTKYLRILLSKQQR